MDVPSGWGAGRGVRGASSLLPLGRVGLAPRPGGHVGRQPQTLAGAAATPSPTAPSLRRGCSIRRSLVHVHRVVLLGGFPCDSVLGLPARSAADPGGLLLEDTAQLLVLFRRIGPSLGRGGQLHGVAVRNRVPRPVRARIVILLATRRV